MRERFWGTWRLVAFEVELASGETAHPFGRDAVGKIIYGSDGQMSAVLSRRERPRLAAGDPAEAAVEELAALGEGFLAYCGTYEVTEEAVLHDVEASFVPNWVGTRLRRGYRFDGAGRLILSTPPFASCGEVRRARLVWEKDARG